MIFSAGLSRIMHADDAIDGDGSKILDLFRHGRPMRGRGNFHNSQCFQKEELLCKMSARIFFVRDNDRLFDPRQKMRRDSMMERDPREKIRAIRQRSYA